MKQSLDTAGQPIFITNSSYTQKSGSKQKDSFILAKERGKNVIFFLVASDPLPTNTVALAAIRDLQTQQSLRLGTLPATKSVLLIRSVQKVSEWLCVQRCLESMLQQQSLMCRKVVKQ